MNCCGCFECIGTHERFVAVSLMTALYNLSSLCAVLNVIYVSEV